MLATGKLPAPKYTVAYIKLYLYRGWQASHRKCAISDIAITSAMNNIFSQDKKQLKGHREGFIYFRSRVGQGACQHPNIYIYMYIYINVNTTLYRNSRISRHYCGKTIKDRGLSFGMVPTHILKAKTAKFQVFGSLFFRYPIFKVYTIVYNSAGRFSTPLKTFSSRRLFRPFIE